MNMTFLRRAALSVIMLSMGASAYCQDMIARQAPVDRRLRAVDSVAIQRAVDRDLNNSLSNDVYSSWVTNRAHPYKRDEVPETYRIDLRGFCMPTPSRNVTSRFGYRPAFKRVHKGLDIKVCTGDTIVAAFDGKVRVVRYDEGGYGNYIVIRHNNGPRRQHRTLFRLSPPLRNAFGRRTYQSRVALQLPSTRRYRRLLYLQQK